MKIASIDLGTNTCLLLIIDKNKKSQNILVDEVSYPRIGKNVDKNKIIKIEAFEKTLFIFKRFKKTCLKYNVDTIIATGTSALRDAINKKDFIEHIFINTGIKIKIISGIEEAKRTFLGTVSNKINTTVIDIGGGSTELINGRNNKLKYLKSINIGSVRLTEKYLKSIPPTQNEINNLVNHVNLKLLKLNKNKFNNSTLIGVAGTVTTLASIIFKLKTFDKTKIENKYISLHKIQNILNHLITLNRIKLKSISQISAGRRDIIVAGTLILIGIMKYFGWNKIKVSTRGLRFGTALKSI